MKREEAIEVLQKSMDNTIEMTIREWEEFDKKVAEAIDMAIEALYVDTVHIETYRELYEKYVKLEHASADAVGEKENDGFNTCNNNNNNADADYKSHIRLIDADVLKDLLKARKQFFVDAYGGSFHCMSEKDKARCDEIDACIASIVNAPTESAEAVQLRQTDTLIIADALRYLAQDTERHLSDRTRADALREQILQYGANIGAQKLEYGESLSARPTGEWIPFRDDLLIRENAAEVVGEFFNSMDISLFGRTGVRLARNVLKSVSTVEPLKWIPLNKDGYEPLFEGDYLLCLDDGYIASVYFDGNEWELWVDSGEPIAWMPLPEPYKGGDTE